MWPGLVEKTQGRATFRHVQIGMFDLVPAGDRQHDLFTRADQDISMAWKFEKLWGKVDEVNAKYGRDALTLASQLGQSLHYAGAKIAFNRVPDRFEFQQTLVEATEDRKTALRMQKAIKPRRSAGWGKVYPLLPQTG